MIRAIDSVGFTVSDMEVALHFYTKILPFQLLSDEEVWGEVYESLTGVFAARMRIVRLGLGQEQIQLTEYIAPLTGKLIPKESRSNDLWFQHLAIVVSDIDAAYEQLRAHRIRHVSTSPQTLPESISSAAGIKAFYFQDPDGHNLELIQFPEGKGTSRWQSNEAIFLGIDHSAIAVSSTEASKLFYHGALQLKAAGESLNFGTEQEHLNGVLACQVRITGWRAENGMGLEFLDYLSPRTGHPMPPHSQANDIWHWEIIMQSDDIEEEHRILRAARPIVNFSASNPYGVKRAFMHRDPDGHAIKIIEKE